MPRASWSSQGCCTGFSQDPLIASALFDSLATRDVSDFRYALEVMSCDPNLIDASTGLSVFQTVLQTPKSAELIKLCINHGADLYTVRTFKATVEQLITFNKVRSFIQSRSFESNFIQGMIAWFGTLVVYYMRCTNDHSLITHKMQSVTAKRRQVY